MLKTILRAALVTMTLSAAALAAEPAKIAQTDKGATLVDAKGMTLYTWIKDTKPGDITGDGFLDGAWHVATP